MSVSVSPRVLATQVDEFLPFALLTHTASQQAARGISVARRDTGEVVGQGTLTVAGAAIRFTGGDAPAEMCAALSRAVEWLPGKLDGEYPICYRVSHCAPVEVDGDGVSLDDITPDAASRDALALAWIAALTAYGEGDVRLALRSVLDVYLMRTPAERLSIKAGLADGRLDAGNLCSIFLERSACETAADELERWESWFLGQRKVDLPYNRRAVIDILESETIDPDEKRLLIHDVVRTFDQQIEKNNLERMVAEIRAKNQELIFGRMSRAFHNQSLLFANAGYVQIDDTLRDLVADLFAACAGAVRLAPPADRLRMMLQGARETALTGTLGALELLENAILDDQRRAVDTLLKASREGRPVVGSVHEAMSDTDILLGKCRALRDAILGGKRRPAAYVILSQRIFPLESHLLARINELQEPYLGKPDNLKVMVRKGGHRMYSSADYNWLQHADHWVEAIPLFIKERVLVVDGVEITETVIDQAILEETFREQFADHWAANLDNVMDSEHVALARELLASSDDRLAGDDRARATAVTEHGLIGRVALLAALIAETYRRHAEQVHLLAEQERLSRYDALADWLQQNVFCEKSSCLEEAFAELIADQQALAADTDKLAKIAGMPRRAIPALHVLTTQSARMSDTYVRTWLEESMTLGNIIRAHGLNGDVTAKINGYRALISDLGRRLINELGMSAEVEELMAVENLPEAMAIARVVAGNFAISRQLSILAVLGEHFGLQPGQEAPLVDRLLKERADDLRTEALRSVYERNDLELLPKLDAYRAEHSAATEEEAISALILGNPDYADDLAAFTRFAAREAAVHELDRDDATLCLAARVENWLRNHSRLSLTTARREVLLEKGLNHLTLHPLYYYRAAGGNKRYHQLYTPSRVDLGPHERESVESWSQWVGGADKDASRVGRRAYGLINKNVKMFESLTEPEVIKTGENASMVANFSYANAMSLLVNSVGRGDIEDLGDQMSLRKDRIILPGGEGYGGYCVPKDGLFLEFVLILTRATKLRQLGVPDHMHAGIVALGKELLARRSEFATDLEWEAWAMKLVAERKELNGYFNLKEGKDGPVPVYQITRIARALTQLGRPELTEAFEVLSNLAARWGIHKVIVGGEQVNRFMPFFKVWSTYQAMQEAQKLNPQVPVKTKDFTVVLTAEYKPDTQDGRFSIGMRKYELFAGTGEHLTYSLDVPGQDLVHLMFNGFQSLWENQTDPRLRARLSRVLAELQIREDDAASIHTLSEMFPGCTAPADIRMVSPMKLTTSDLLHYTSDTHLEQIAMEVHRRLMNAGLTENEITANMQVYGPRLSRWTKLRDLPSEQFRLLEERIGGGVHALALSILGPMANYEVPIQGADVLDTGIPHKDLLALLADPMKLCYLMLEGNPNSGLVIMDGASGARRRAMNRMAIMRWFAAGEAAGRNAIYRAVGLGAEMIESWRDDMRHQRSRAKKLLDRLAAGHSAAAQEQYAAIISELRDGQETAVTLETEERMLRFNKLTEQEAAVSRAQAAVTSGLPLEKLDFGAWLGLGGQFLVMGVPQEKLADIRRAFERGIAALGGAPAADENVVAALYCPAYVPATEEFREEKGIESSNKATEEVAAVAIDTRKSLAARAARAKALNEREQAFGKALESGKGSSVELIAAAKAARGDGGAITQQQFGELQALTRLSLLALGRELFTDDPNSLGLLKEHMELLLIGRELDPLAIRSVSGGYEDPGDLSRLAQTVVESFRDGNIDESMRDAKLALVADVAELFDSCRAVALTIDFFTVTPESMAVWRALADFYAESLNDHFYEYRPWAYSRGIGFAHVTGDNLYTLAVAHHRWQYRYLRGVALKYTEMAGMPAETITDLLGDMGTAAQHPPIGADGKSDIERVWRAYNQLRELAFVRNDGFPLPQVFPSFDPAIIDADTRVNMVCLYPVGRTHVSRALMEGPTLTKELAAEGRPGVNLLITRDAQVVELPEMKRPVLQITNAHVYISREEYIAALKQHRGLSAKDAEALAAEHVGPKGVRIAARFTKPITLAVVVPFHGNQLYDTGKLEVLGLPYSSQSRFHTWTTYDKAKYPEIFCPETGVELPGEMDWLAADTAALGEEATRNALEHGDPSRNFPGFRQFAQSYRLVMVKDAAESGGRGQKAFNLRLPDGSFDEEAIGEAVEFTYQITLKHNVAIQEVIIASPEFWATEDFLRSFVDRQVQEWGAAVNRTWRPRTNIYGSQRLIFSSSDPLKNEWHVSHPIALCSRQLITNVGRGGTLDILKQEFIRPEYRDQLWARLQESGEKCMQALARYEGVAGERYTQETDNTIGQDASGLSYAVPRYMMLDFLVQPIFAEEGTLVDLEPVYSATGERTGISFILQQGDERVPGTVVDWRVVLIEPNIGIGLWDRVAIREEFFARATAAQDTAPIDWNTVGANARVVLKDLAKAGQDYLQAVKK
ncbi:MAG: hypothetical protein ACYC7E_12870 [Armatimonadota bacterium]